MYRSLKGSRLEMLESGGLAKQRIYLVKIKKDGGQENSEVLGAPRSQETECSSDAKVVKVGVQVESCLLCVIAM